jgi:hypothetical protein
MRSSALRTELRRAAGLPGRWTVRGLAVLGVVLFAVFWFVRRLGAGTLTDLLEVAVFSSVSRPR